MNRFLTLTIFLLLVLAGTTKAETIALKRGLPTDIWLTWPDAARLDDPGLVNLVVGRLVRHCAR